MHRRKFGSTGIDVPVIGLGTWRLEEEDRQEAIAALQAGIDAGASHVDTAEMYGGGKAEEVVAEAIAGRRDRVYLVTKVLPENASRAGVVRSCEASLARLKTDHLDCYLLHWPGPHPLEATLEGFEELQQAGKIRSYGVSNFDVELLEQVVALAGPGKIACNQVLHHLEERYAEDRLLGPCKRLGVALVAYSPFGSGEFPSDTSDGGRVLAEVAGEQGVSTRQIALAFLIRLEGTFAIPKSRSARRVVENAAASHVKLTQDQVLRLETAFPVRSRRALPTL